VFVKMRKMLTDNTDLRLAIEKLERSTENNKKNIELVFQYIDELTEKKENPELRNKIGYTLSKKQK
ncbi:MAG: ORF6N domain-containing protein, partial [Bacteroidia bacterium]